MEFGVNGWWLDGGEPDIYPDEILHFNGKTRGEYSNIINLLWLKMLYDGYRSDFPEMRPFFMTRSGWAGAQHYGAFPLCGDEARSWLGLKAMLPVMLGASMSGISYLHSDIGGFAPKDALMHNELYIRWFQLGTFSPIMRAHRVLPIPAEPIFYNKKVQNIVRKFIHLRYTFLPYNYTLAYLNTVSGLPLMKPIDFYESDNKLLHNINDEFLWGSDILVAPILDSVFQRDFVLPKGKWIDWFTGSVFEGNDKYTMKVPIDRLLLFVHSGAIIPTAEPMSNTMNYKADSLILHYFPDTSTVNSSFRMFNDDGKNNNSISENKFEFLDFKSLCKSNEIHFIMTEQSADGKYKSVDKRNIKLCIHNIPFKPGSIKINSKRIKIENSFSLIIPDNDYAVFIKKKNEMWIHLTWNNDSTNIVINNIIDNINTNEKSQMIVVNQPVPNPFVSETKVEYSINTSAYFVCTIYDIKMRLVDEWNILHNYAGKYYLVWDGKDYDNKPTSAGFYFLKLYDRMSKKSFVRVLLKK